MNTRKLIIKSINRFLSKCIDIGKNYTLLLGLLYLIIFKVKYILKFLI